MNPFSMLGEIVRHATTGPMKMSGPRRPPTPVEKMLLVAAAAQVLAGPGRNPTPAQLADAKRAVAQKLAGRTSTSGSWSSGASFWSKVKNVAKGAGQAAVSTAPSVAKWAMRNPQVVLPLAAGAVASPFLIKAIAVAAQSKQAQSAAASKPPEAPPGSVTVPVPPPEATAAPAEEPPSAPSMSMGSMNDDELAAASCCGGAERAALARVRGEAAISHDGYRAAIMQRAQRLAGGGAPTTKHVLRAENSVRRDLARSGLRVAIPGAAPSRRTL